MNITPDILNLLSFLLYVGYDVVIRTADLGNESRMVDVLILKNNEVQMSAIRADINSALEGCVTLYEQETGTPEGLYTTGLKHILPEHNFYLTEGLNQGSMFRFSIIDRGTAPRFIMTISDDADYNLNEDFKVVDGEDIFDLFNRV